MRTTNDCRLCRLGLGAQAWRRSPGDTARRRAACLSPVGREAPKTGVAIPLLAYRLNCFRGSSAPLQAACPPVGTTAPREPFIVIAKCRVSAWQGWAQIQCISPARVRRKLVSPMGTQAAVRASCATTCSAHRIGLRARLTLPGVWETRSRGKKRGLHFLTELPRGTWQP
jgi:hypothetical protein